MEDALRVRDVHKSYVEGIPVLSGVDLSVPSGQITALVGANGSGKSTLVKVLSGYHAADRGVVEIRGVPFRDIAPGKLRSAGIRFVHQESTIVPTISVLENLSVGGYETSAGRIRWRAERARVRSLLDDWGMHVDPDLGAAALSAATIAKLGMLKAIRMRPGDEPVHAVILDEPTAALGTDDATELLTWLHQAVAQQGIGVLFISHRLDEVLAFADRVCVLRSGKIVAEVSTRGLDEDSLVEHLVGARLSSYYPPRERTTSQRTVLTVAGASGRLVREFSLRVSAGETVGITGLPGSGFEEIPSLLMDPAVATSGELQINGVTLPLARAPLRARVRNGLALIPSDRKRRALATELSLRENVTLPRLGTFRSAGFQRLRREVSETRKLIQEFSISPEAPGLAAGRFSGGNQQKAVLAKWLAAAPVAMVVDEPTQAVDVHAKSEIFRLLKDAAGQGMATILVSVEYEDLAHVCDRVLVVAGGRVAQELSGEDLTGANLAAVTLRAA